MDKLEWNSGDRREGGAATHSADNEAKPRPRPNSAQPSRPEHVARDLLAGGRQAVISHEGRRNLLSLTRANKLILTRDDDASS